MRQLNHRSINQASHVQPQSGSLEPRSTILRHLIVNVEQVRFQLEHVYSGAHLVTFAVGPRDARQS